MLSGWAAIYSETTWVENGASVISSSLDPNKIAALFGALALLAALPSVSVLAVTAKSASSGFIYGAFTALGIVVGDLIFILLAVFGLALLVETLGSLFFLINYAGGAYLIWLGLSLWRSNARSSTTFNATSTEPAANPEASRLTSLITGLLITLGDQKAIFFYLGFLPAFLDLATLTSIDIGIVVLVTFFAVGGVKLGYAYAAAQAGLLLGRSIGAVLNAVAAGIMVVAGIVIMARA